MKFNPHWLVVGLVVAAASAAAAQNAASVIQARQAHYKEIGRASKGIHDELGKPAPSAAALQGFAKTIDTLAPQIPTWFPAGSGAEAGVKTAAKPQIWTDAAGFRAVASAFATEAHHFDEVAQTGNVEAIRAEYANLGKACFACHSKYRAKE